jgi:hypothetical protein
LFENEKKQQKIENSKFVRKLKGKKKCLDYFEQKQKLAQIK